MLGPIRAFFGTQKKIQEFCIFFTVHACTFRVIQSFSQLYRHSHGLHNNLKALINPYPKWKEKNAFRDLEDDFRVPESANRG